MKKAGDWVVREKKGKDEENRNIFAVEPSLEEPNSTGLMVIIMQVTRLGQISSISEHEKCY